MIIQTYKELSFYIEMFKNGNADLLIIEGKGGLAKSRLVEDIMQEKPYLKIVSHVSPMKLFILGYEYLDKPIIFDDCDTLLRDDNSVALLKMFCDTSIVKTINWATTSELLSHNGIPERYETKSKVIIICNSFNELTEKISALRDRGFHIIFAPTNQEILSKMREIIPVIHSELTLEEKTKIYEVIERYSNVCDVSLRTLVKGIALFKEAKERGMDWQALLLSNLELNSKLILLDKLLRDYDKDVDRIKVWEDEGFSRRNYYEYKSKLSAKVTSSLENLHKDSSLEINSSLAQPILTT
jgi:hypothetical protein